MARMKKLALLVAVVAISVAMLMANGSNETSTSGSASGTIKGTTATGTGSAPNTTTGTPSPIGTTNTGTVTEFDTNGNITCYCNQTDDCDNDDTCTTDVGGSCFRASIAIENQGDLWSASGCAKALGSNVAYSLTIMSVQAGLAFVAISQCATNNCNHPKKSWTSIGVNFDEQKPCFNTTGDVMTVIWNRDGHVINNISEWCPECDEDRIRKPKGNESLCSWIYAVRNESLRNESASSGGDKGTLEDGTMYASIGIMGAVFMVGVGISVFEFLKAMKDKRAHPTAPKKKKVHREIKLASPLTPFTMLPAPTVLAKAPQAKTPEAEVPGAKTPQGKDNASTKSQEPKSSQRQKASPTASAKSKTATEKTAKK